MAAVRDAGVDVPQFLGRDEQDRQILEFVPGTLAMDAGPLLADDLVRVGSLVRAIHEASEGFVPTCLPQWTYPIASPPGSNLICHGDLAPWNLVTGDRWVFIDWAGSSPSTRLWDLAYAAVAFTLSDASLSPKDAAARIRAFVDGYDADATLRASLPRAMVRRAGAMFDLLRTSNLKGVEPWGTMYTAGHGEHWYRVVEYVERHQGRWRDALSLSMEH
jgi:tRNA A-37 threonylcarbamoyl transferase component Bud32